MYPLDNGIFQYIIGEREVREQSLCRQFNYFFLQQGSAGVE